jgi:hypothetical protein
MTMIPYGLAQGFGQMNPMEAVERELECYRRFTRQPNLGNLGGPTAVNAPLPVADGNAQVASGIPFLGAAPPDPPFPPAVIIPTETIVSHTWGAIYTVCGVLMLVFYKFYPLYVIAGGLYGMHKMYEYGNGTGRFNFEQEMKQQQRLLPPPNTMQHYVIQMASTN